MNVSDSRDQRKLDEYLNRLDYGFNVGMVPHFTNYDIMKMLELMGKEIVRLREKLDA